MQTKITFPFHIQQVDDFSIIAELSERAEVFGKDALEGLLVHFTLDEAEAILEFFESHITRKILMDKLGIKTTTAFKRRLDDCDKI